MNNIAVNILTASKAKRIDFISIFLQQSTKNDKIVAKIIDNNNAEFSTALITFIQLTLS